MARKEGIPVDTLDFACRVVNRDDVDYNYLKQFSDNPAVLVKQLSFPPTLEKNNNGVSYLERWPSQIRCEIVRMMF